jgi:hypothetical protein
VKLVAIFSFLLCLNGLSAREIDNRKLSTATNAETIEALSIVQEIDIDHWLSLQPKPPRKSEVEIYRLDFVDKSRSIYE